MELEEIPGKLNRTSKSKGKKKRSYVRQGVFPLHTETARLGQGLYSSAAKSVPSPYPCLLSPHIIQCYCEIFLKSINLQAGMRGRCALSPSWGWGGVPGAEQRIPCSSLAAGHACLTLPMPVPLRMVASCGCYLTAVT